MMEVHTFHKNNFCLKQDSSTAKSQLNWKCICLKFLAYCLPLNHCVFGYTRATIVLRKIRYDLRLQQYKMIQKKVFLLSNTRPIIPFLSSYTNAYDHLRYITLAFIASLLSLIRDAFYCICIALFTRRNSIHFIQF